MSFSFHISWPKFVKIEKHTSASHSIASVAWVASAVVAASGVAAGGMFMTLVCPLTALISLHTCQLVNPYISLLALADVWAHSVDTFGVGLAVVAMVGPNLTTLINIYSRKAGTL